MFLKCDFSEEQCSSLKMILGSKHVGAVMVLRYAWRWLVKPKHVAVTLTFMLCWRNYIYNKVNIYNQWVFLKCDLSKEQCSSLKMILGSKYVGAVMVLRYAWRWLVKSKHVAVTLTFMLCWRNYIYNTINVYNQWVFLKCDFSKEQCSSLKMILGSKYVGAILNVLM